MRIITQDGRNDIPYDYSVIYTQSDLIRNRTYVKADTPIGSYVVGSYASDAAASEEIENMHEEYEHDTKVYRARKNEDV